MNVEFEVETVLCAECGVVILLPSQYVTHRRNDHRLFYCLNGHSQNFPAEAPAERYKRLWLEEGKMRGVSEEASAKLARKVKKLEKEARHVNESTPSA